MPTRDERVRNGLLVVGVIWFGLLWAGWHVFGVMREDMRTDPSPPVTSNFNPGTCEGQPLSIYDVCEYHDGYSVSGGAYVGSAGDSPPTRTQTYGSSSDSDESESDRQYREEYEYNDYGSDSSYDSYDEPDPCIGDCNDMDNDGRTSNDVDADGDGLYETP